MVSLLDVNVLIALFDSSHANHEAAHAWFATNRSGTWATCPLTENALIRMLANPAYRGTRTTIEDAASRLRTFCSADDHLFWTDSFSVRERQRFQWRHIQGHRQLTDVYLLALAVSKGGRLVTFDASISIRGVDAAKADNLALIEV